jgi:outer membrane protein insertion porin family
MFMKKSIRFLFLLIALPIYFLNASESYDDKIVEKVDIIVENKDETQPYDIKKIISSLKTKQDSPFSQTDFDSDLKTLSDQFDKVIPYIQLNNDKVFISLKVWPKPIIRNILWQGNELIATKKLQKKLDIKPGTVFTRTDFNKSFNKVKDFYIQKGYFESHLTYEIEPTEKNEINIIIHVNEGPSGKIKNIEFKGFTKKEKSDVLGMIYTRKYNLLTTWLTGNGIYKEESLEQDKITITNYLQNEGYADAKIDINSTEAPDGKIIIEITAHRGTLYRFGSVTFSGNEKVTNEQIEKLLIIHKGNQFSPEKIRQAAQVIKDYYGQKGYLDTEVMPDAQLMENEPVYNINFQIEESEIFRIGMIHIIGNQQTKSNVILRESLLIPGDVFDSRKLKATQQKLSNIGYFKNVNVYAVKASDDTSLGPNYRDVYIEVEETTTGTASINISFSTLDQAVIGLDITETNFNIKGIKDISKEGLGALRGGGEFFQTKVNGGMKERNLSLSWLDPYLLDTLWRLGFEISATQSKLQSKDYSIKTYGFSLYASYPITNFWTFGTKYRLRDVHNNVKGSAGEEAVSEGDRQGWISAVSTSISYDCTDNPYKPHKGIRSVLDGEFVGVGGNYTFAKIQYINALYHPLFPKGTMKYRADVKFIEPLLNTTKEKIPLSERFFLGGSDSVRGYKPYIIGPHFKDANGKVKNKDPKGGISSLLLSIEYSYELLPVADLFTFFDAGSISEEHFKFHKLVGSCGIGMHLQIVSNMPIIFGYAIPIKPERHKDVKKFFFYFGGQF